MADIAHEHRLHCHYFSTGCGCGAEESSYPYQIMDHINGKEHLNFTGCGVWSLLTVISLILSFISTTAAEPRAAVSPAYGCVLYNETYICSGSQYQMYCDTRMHHFYYQRDQDQHQYHCMSNDCICVGNNDTCACYYNTSSCFCEIFSNNIITYGNITALTIAVSPVYDCARYNDLYICTGAQYHMYCNTSVHDFDYDRYHYYCLNNNCYCFGNKDTCTCYSSTSSSCFCTNNSSSITIPAAVSPVYDCGLYNDTYICTGAQYHMYCDTRMHHFYYWKYRDQNQYEYECWGNNCYCFGNNDTCTCYSSTLSSCFCETYNNSIALPTAVSSVTDPDCVRLNDMYICTGAQYRMYCNTQMHDFSYQRSQYKYQYLCVNNDCDCFGNTDTCTCSTSTLSSCFCKTYGNITALTIAVSPVYDCARYNDLYICTGAQYHMYCNTSVHDFDYDRYHYYCLNNNCYCFGNKDTCTCYSSTSSSCFCTNNSSSITIPAAVSPVYDCGLYNDTYICTGAQYHMYCDTRMHHFYYWKYRDQNQYEYECWGNNCYCFGNNDTCTCYSSTLSSCFCETYNNSIALPTAVSSVTDPDCVRLNDMYICTGAQYRMYCNTQMHDFSYQRSQYKYQYLCVNNDCDCFGNTDTCTCSTSTLSSCFCKTYGNITALTIAVSPVYDCARYNDLYICTGAQYHMYCNTSVHDFDYDRYHYYCLNNNCYCFGNKDTCTCYSSTSSSCFCTNNSSSITIPAAVSPVYDCGLYNDTYICTGAQYHMYCDTRMHHFYYWKYRDQNQYEYECWDLHISPLQA
ncbi:uncharacterized protein [Sinocyclocheilus grahami]|uniref:uncharacterized protein n=1 Tax=Sinocyclocheilus grahami TaxID=75366 RepID=UPI0007AD2C62|nr:PREDICTED: uncharacterized protein LOC107548697 [Sinocyclocheilus grahami]